MSYPVCPCDGELPGPSYNLPELSYISYRVGDYVSFRQAVLTPLLTPATPLPLPLEQTLSVNGVPVWTTDGAGDLAVMIAEWFAYIGDIIAFYNERIANQDYLRTASLPESVNNLIALLGYRPRPAIGAYGNIAALLSSGPSFGKAPILLPQGLQFQSKPAPGLTPQTFELQAATPLGTPITGPDQYAVAPAPVLLDNSNNLLLQGAAANLAPGDFLLVTALDGTTGGPWLAELSATSPASGGSQSLLDVTWITAAPPENLASASLSKPGQSSGLWTLAGFNPIDTSAATIDLAGLARQINPGDWLVVSSSTAAALVQVASTADLLWDANAADPSTTSPPFATVTTTSGGTTTTTTPLPLPHTRLTFAALGSTWSSATGVKVQFGFAAAGQLAPQPFASWSGAPTTLSSIGGQNFPVWSKPRPMQLQDATGLGIAVTATSTGNTNVTISFAPSPVPALTAPFLLLPNLLYVNCGKTIANEVLGSGNASLPAQDFQLSQSPVTYLTQGSSTSSTISLTVNGLPWTEVPFFYGQAPDATVFVSRQDNQNKTHVMFGDGINGARLPTGVNNVVATYRIGSGAAMPAAGKLTVIAKSYPGLSAVLNPVAVIGGDDADQPRQIVHDAPRSVLTFGRAVSVFDYQALAEEVPSVTRARAIWGWSNPHQRTMVIVYVGDTPGAVTAAAKALAASGDPNRPVFVTAASQIAIGLALTLLVTPGMDTTIIGNAITTALTDTETGLFGAWNMPVGQTLFDSQIEAAVLSVAGAVAITQLRLTANGIHQASELHLPGNGGFYTLAASDIGLTMEPDPNG
jgi:hypothetical protein